MISLALEHDGSLHALTGPMVLGRHADCDLRLTSAGVSRQHARIRPGKGGAMIEDLGSANGTRVNGSRITTATALHKGDIITIGMDRLVMVLGSETIAPDAKGMAGQAPLRRVSPQPNNLKGQLIQGYRIQRLLADGLSGTVYEARQLSLDRNVAFRVLPRELGRDSQLAQRIIAEARQAGAVEHEHLARMHEVGQEGDLIWASMELVQGDTIADLVARDGRMPPEGALVVLERVGRALVAAHAANLVHGDIRPANVVLTREGGVKLLNLGISRLARSRLREDQLFTCGALFYTSPNWQEGGQPGPRDDLYSLGCLLHTMLCGKPPYEGHSPASIARAHREHPLPCLHERIPGMPVAVDEVMHGMMAKNPEWRFASVNEWLGCLSELRDTLRRLPGPAPLRPAARAASPSSGLSRQPSKELSVPRRSPLPRLLLLTVLLAALWVSWQHLRPGSGTQGPGDPKSTPRRSEQAGPLVSSGTGQQAALQHQATPRQQLVSDWPAQRAEAEAAEAAGHWNRAEQLLDSFAEQLRRAGDTTLVASVERHRRQMHLASQQDWDQQVAALPEASRERLLALAALRDRVCSVTRADLESRYRAALRQHALLLTEARLRALRRVEAGELDGLPRIAAEMRHQFEQTPLMAAWERFDLQLREASRLPWQGSWPATRSGLSEARGAQVLPAAAALMLAGDEASALRLLLGDGALERPPLRQRRDALLTNHALVLTFDDATDLRHLGNFAFATPTVSRGRLSAPAGEPCQFEVLATLGATDWELSLDLMLQPDEGSDGMAVLSLVEFGQPLLELQMGHEGLHWVRGNERRQLTTRATGRLHVTLRQVDGRLSCYLGTRRLVDAAPALPAGARPRIDVAGLQWSLYGLHLVGGH